MNRRRLYFAVAVLSGLLCPASAQEVAAVTSSSAKTIVDVIDIAPWGYSGIDGKPAGIYPTIFKRLAERSGCPLEPRLTPIPRAVLEVSHGTAGLTMMLDRSDLNANALVLGEVASLQIEVWLPPGSALRSLEELAGKKVGILRGPSYHEGFDKDSRIQKHPVTNPRQQLEMLSKGRLDGAIGVRENFLTAASQMGVAPKSFAPPIDLGRRIVKLWATSSLGDEPCAKQLAKALKDMRNAGEVDQIMSRAANANR